jgi:hypothetical protein
MKRLTAQVRAGDDEQGRSLSLRTGRRHLRSPRPPQTRQPSQLVA